MNPKNSLLDVFSKSLSLARENNFSSYDISDLMKTKYNLVGSSISNLLLKKAFMKPYAYLMKYQPELIRKGVKEKYYCYPQGVAMTIRGLCQMINKGYNIQENTLLAKELGEWLVNNKSDKSINMSWGQPFVWYSRKTFPANISRATVSSQVGWAFIDLFELTNDERYLSYTKSISKCFKEEFNYTIFEDNSLCISYTTVDNYHIHNANVLASSMIARSAKLTNNSEYLDFARQATDFSVKHQNDDGSFYYWAPPNKLAYKIDNIHTGFVLESIFTLMKDLDDESLKSVYLKGLTYFEENLFQEDLPKLDIKRVYPIDIQCCAQAIITFAQSKDSELVKKAQRIANYTIDNFFIRNKSHFAYRIHDKSGYRDDSYYFRWGDAWMLKAIPYLL